MAFEFSSSGHSSEQQDSPEKKSFLKVIGASFRKLFSKEQQKEKLRDYQEQSDRPFADSEYFQVSKKAEVTTDHEGNVVELENNRAGELTGFLGEVYGGDNKETIEKIRSLSYEDACNVDEGLRERIENITSKIQEKVDPRFKMQVLIRNHETVGDWVKRAGVMMYSENPEILSVGGRVDVVQRRKQDKEDRKRKIAERYSNA